MFLLEAFYREKGILKLTSLYSRSAGKLEGIQDCLGGCFPKIEIERAGEKARASHTTATFSPGSRSED